MNQRKFLIHFCGLLFLLFTFYNLCEANIHTPNGIYVDSAVKDFQSLAYLGDTKVFHLVSHSKPGALLINDQWLTSEELAHWLKESSFLRGKSQLMIYGCEFAKGEKGLRAVQYLERTLRIAVSASTNITGKDGDWHLEVGNSTAAISITDYPYNLQDTDGDGILGDDDLDDDNDGISGLDECESNFQVNFDQDSENFFVSTSPFGTNLRAATYSNPSPVTTPNPESCTFSIANTAGSYPPSPDGASFILTVDNVNGETYFSNNVDLAAIGFGIMLPPEKCSDGKDNDGDGLIDCYDCDECFDGAGCPDNDGDGIGDACDLDDDNDGIPDVNEGQKVDFADWSLSGVAGTGTFNCSNGPNFSYTVNGHSNIVINSSEVFDDGAQHFETNYSQADGKENLNITINAPTPEGDPITFFATLNIVFDNPTDSVDWAFALTDIDKDQIQIRALDASGNPVGVAVISSWLQELFDTDPVSFGSNIPFWDNANSAVVGSEDSDGAYNTVTSSGNSDSETAGAWFRPNVSLSEITLIYSAFEFNDNPNYHIHIVSRCGEDADNDGIVNHLDLDSDNDGILDVDEAGHSAMDTDNDGIIDGAPSTFGTNGLFDGIETTADNDTINYTIADSEVNPNGTYDAYELDSDGDGCFDTEEESVIDSDSDGIAGTGVPMVDVVGRVNAITYVAPPNDNWQNPAIGNCLPEICSNGIDDNADGTIDEDCPAACSQGVDTDGDGIGDLCDIDDDNDGIPDSDEEKGCKVLNTNLIGNWDSNGGAGVGTISSDNADGTYVTSNASPATVGPGVTSFLLGNGTSMATSNAMQMEGIDQVDLSGAKINGDFLQLDFSTGAFTATNIYIDGFSYAFYLSNTDNTIIQGDYEFQVEISDDNFSTSSVLVNSTNLNKITIYSEDIYVSSTVLEDGLFNQFLKATDFYNLSPSTSYQIRVYFYNDQDADGIIILDDIQLKVSDYCDTDGDGVFNQLDLDSDNDGIYDVIEAGHFYPDADDDGMVDGFFFGTNGLFDTLETAVDNGILDYNIANSEAAPDGIYDPYELDSDGDGCFDAEEEGVTDGDNDGIAGTGVPMVNARGMATTITYVDPPNFTWIFPNVGSCLPELCNDGIDNDNNGLTDCKDCESCYAANSCDDLDNDNIGKYCDLDDDNDGIPDIIEGQDSTTFIDLSAVTFNSANIALDLNTNVDYVGMSRAGPTTNPPPSGNEYINGYDKVGGLDTIDINFIVPIAYIVPQSREVTFVYEYFANIESDNNRTPYVYNGANTKFFILHSSVGDLVTNYTLTNNQVDALNAGEWIELEITFQLPAVTVPGSTIQVTGTEFAIETIVGGYLGSFFPRDSEVFGVGLSGVSTCKDTDNDGICDKNDLDSDNDGISDVVENNGGNVFVDHSGGTTLDGVVGDNASVTDTDADGWHDPSNSTILDTDGDGIADYLDLDADNDGIPDYLEGVCSTCPTFGAPSGSDSDGDGVLDIYENLTSTNANSGTNTGTAPNEDDDDISNPPDYLDTDADNDGAYDWTEGFDTNGDGKVIDDFITMAADYEMANGTPGDYNTTDTDSDGIPDWMDNQPGIVGYDESVRPPFLDAASAYWIDSNNNGLADIFDPDANGTLAPTPDNNAGNDRDWRDVNTTVSLPVELVDFRLEIVNCTVMLHWQSSAEVNFDYFEIEYSVDGRAYEVIKAVTGRGNSISGASYQYRDDQVSHPENYYRLKMIDYDGSFEYTDILSAILPCKQGKRDLKVYPNPAGPDQHNLSISHFSPAFGDVAITIMDLNGRPVHRTQMSADEGWNTVHLDIRNLAYGAYFIQVHGENARLDPITAKFIKLE